MWNNYCKGFMYWLALFWNYSGFDLDSFDATFLSKATTGSLNFLILYINFHYISKKTRYILKKLIYSIYNFEIFTKYWMRSEKLVLTFLINFSHLTTTRRLSLRIYSSRKFFSVFHFPSLTSLGSSILSCRKKFENISTFCKS